MRVLALLCLLLAVANAIPDNYGMVKWHNWARRGEHPMRFGSGNPDPRPALVDVTWNSGLADATQGYVNGCPSGHDPNRNYQGKYAGENAAWNSRQLDGEDVGYDAVKRWHDEADDYNFNSQGCSGVCGHYTQIVWADSVEIGCGVKRGGCQWYLTVFCRYLPGGNYNGRQPYRTDGPANPPPPPPPPPPPACPTTPPANLCAARCGQVTDPANGCVHDCTCTSPDTCNGGQCICVPSPSGANAWCSANNKQCGQQTATPCTFQYNCGQCAGANDQCNNGRCVCQPTPTTTVCANRECGSLDNGCGTAVSCGTCSATQACKNGKCENNCQPRDISQFNCGSVSNGCQMVDLGACPTGQRCASNVCEAITCNPGCDANAQCNAGTCSCNNGYNGNGVTCTPDKPAYTEPLDWEIVDSNSAWAFQTDDNNYMSAPADRTVPNQMAYSSSDAIMASAQGSYAFWVCQFTPASADATFGQGLRLGQPGRDIDGLWFDVNTKDSKIYYQARYNGKLLELISGDIDSTIGQPGVPLWLRMYTSEDDQGQLTTIMSVMDENFGQLARQGWKWSKASSYYPETGKAFITAQGDGDVVAGRCFVADASTVEMTLTDCSLSDDELSFLIANMLRVNPSSVTINSGCAANKKRQAETVISATVIGTASTTAQSMTSGAVAAVAAGTAPVLASNGAAVTGASVAATIVATGAVGAVGAGLSAGAIAGIAVGAAAVAAGVTAGAVVAAKKSKKQPVVENSIYEPEPVSSKPAPPPRSEVRRSVYKMYKKDPGVSIDVGEQTVDGHKSITARQHQISKDY